MNRSTILLILAVAFILAAPPVKADTVVSTFQPGGLFNPTFGLGGTDGSPVAYSFVAPSSSDFVFTGATIAAFVQQNSSSNLAYVTLATSVFNHPGFALETFQLVDVLQPFGLSGQVVTVNSSLNPTLVAGSTYWLILGSSDPGTIYVWTTASVAPPGMERAISQDGGTSWTTVPVDRNSAPGAFTIFGVPPAVPEPSTYILLLSGILLFAAAHVCWRLLCPLVKITG